MKTSVVGNCDIDIFVFCQSKILKFPKFERVQNSAVNFWIAQASIDPWLHFIHFRSCKKTKFKQKILRPFNEIWQSLMIDFLHSAFLSGPNFELFPLINE